MTVLRSVSSALFLAALLPGQVPVYSIRTVAGTTAPGDGGLALNAALAAPLGKVAADSAGNVYFTDSTKVHRVGLDGVMTAVAGGGSGSTPALQANLTPYSLALDSANNLYVASLFGDCQVRRINLGTGAIAGVAGTGACSAGPDGPASSTTFSQITGLAVDPQGRILVSERFGYRVRRVDLNASTVTTLIGTGTSGNGADGQLAGQTALGNVEDVAVDSRGEVFVLDGGNCVVRKIDPATNLAHIVAGVAGKCGFAGDGPALSTQLDKDTALAVSSAGDVVYIGEGALSNRIRKLDLGAGQITTIAGQGNVGAGGDGGPASQASLAWPIGIAIRNGSLLISEYVGGRVRMIDSSQNMQAFAGLAGTAKGDGGPALAALLVPNLVDPDGKGGLVIFDAGHRRVRSVSNGVISLVAGTNAFLGSAGDGGPATQAGLFNCLGMAVDPAGPIYVDETTGDVRVISGGTIRSVINLQNAFPVGMALDPSHRFLYIAEYTGNRVVKVDVTNGTATTIAGFGNPTDTNGPAGDDGDNLTATKAHLNTPVDVAVDSSGLVYVMDSKNHVIRRIDPAANTMVTVAGNHSVPTTPAADGTPATLASLAIGSGITVDSSGNIFFAEGSRIRRVDGVTHILTTVAGTGVSGFSGDGGPALSAQIASPGGMSVDAQGNIYFADNSRIRVLSPPATAPRIAVPIVAANFGAGFNITPGTWMEIYGEKLSPTNRQWTGADFNGNQAPNSLDNVKVLINGKQGYIDLVSAGQINVQVPDGIGTGNVTLQVVAPNGSSDPVVLTASDRSPALLAPPSFSANQRQYVAALFPDGSFVGPPNLIPGAPFNPAHTGDTIILYGIGFGSGTPAVPAGVIDTQATSLPNVTVSIGGVNAQVTYAGLAANFVGLYQFNVVIPSGVAGEAILKDVLLSVSVNGVPVQQVLYLTIG